MTWLDRIKSKAGDWNHVSQLVEDARRVLGDAQMPTRLVLTNGCFDIMHPGHVWRLHEASLLGDILIVSLDADDDVLRAKGKLAMPWADRAQMVSCLSFVAGVTWHTSEPCWRRPAADCTLPSLLRFLRPDVWVARHYGLPPEELQAAEEVGTEVLQVGWVGDWSSTVISRRLLSGG